MKLKPMFVLGKDDQWIGTIFLKIHYAKEAKQTVEQLRHQGLKKDDHVDR